MVWAPVMVGGLVAEVSSSMSDIFIFMLDDEDKRIDVAGVIGRGFPMMSGGACEEGWGGGIVDWGGGIVDWGGGTDG